MRLNIFKSYYDSTPAEISLDEIVQLIKSDESLRSLTEKHRYYRSLNLKNEAQTFKASCGCFSVAARFDKGKDMKNITELTFIGMAEADHVEPALIPELRRKVREDPHTLLEYVSIGQEGFHVLYRYVITNLSALKNVSFSHLYEAAFDAGNRYYSALLGIPMDPKCRKVTQLSGLAHDPEVFLNVDALPLELAVEPPKTVSNQYHASLNRATRAAKRLLAEEGVQFQKGMRNTFLMRMGYLLNNFGVPLEMPPTGPSGSMLPSTMGTSWVSSIRVTRSRKNTVPDRFRKRLPKRKATGRPFRKLSSSWIHRFPCGTM